MASPVYSVVLNLEGNMNSVLDSAIAKSRILNSELGKVSRNASAGSRTRRRKRPARYLKKIYSSGIPIFRPVGKIESSGLIPSWNDLFYYRIMASCVT